MFHPDLGKYKIMLSIANNHLSIHLMKDVKTRSHPVTISMIGWPLSLAKGNDHARKFVCCMSDMLISACLSCMAVEKVITHISTLSFE
jgi:hypothetical protein